MELVISIRQATRFVRRGGSAYEAIISLITSPNNSTSNYFETLSLPQPQVAISAPLKAATKQLSARWLKLKQTPRVIAHIALSVTVLAVIVTGNFNARQGTPSAVANQTNASLSGIVASEGSDGPVDKTASAYIAAAVAEQVELPMAEAIAQHAEALSTETSQTQVAEANSYLAKPQAITSDGATDVISHYVVAAGDTISSIADKYGINGDTIRWANDLTAGEDVHRGQQLVILPVDGVLHKVSQTDTVDGLAQLYHVDAQLILSFNAIDSGKLEAGKNLIIPGATARQTTAPADGIFVANTPSATFRPTFAANGYDYGWCTWYAASRRAAEGHRIPSNWGNAISWYDNARLSGYRVGYTPRVGAVGWQGRMGMNHVTIIEAVSADGKQVKYSDMNGIAGWGRVGHSDWVPATEFGYIY